MTALLIIAIIVASLAAYLGVGVALARRDLPRSIKANTLKAGQYTRLVGFSRWGTPQTEEYTREHDEICRSFVRAEQARMLWLWPFVAPTRAWRHGLEARIDRYDPAVTRALEADLERLQTKINQLKEAA